MQDTTIITIYNPFAADFLADPARTFARLRSRAPAVFFSPLLNLWVVHRYTDIVDVLKEPTLYSSQNSIRQDGDYPESVQTILQRGYAEISAVLGQPYWRAPGPVNSDPPLHTRLRRLAGSVFMRQWMDALPGHIERVIDEVLTSFEVGKEIDLVLQICDLVPLYVLCEELGIPREDAGRIKAGSLAWTALNSLQASLAQLEVYAEDYMDLQRYAAELLMGHLREPPDTLLGALIQARVGDDRFTLQELVTFITQLLFAGHQTTAAFLPNLLFYLIEHPREWQAMQDPQGASNALEELLRTCGPILGMFRTTSEETLLAGVALPAGATLQLLYAAGNFDSDQFADPQQVDFQRPNARDHLTFGRGDHFCLGAQIARLECQIVQRTLFQRFFPHIRLVEGFQPVFAPNIMFRSVQFLPVLLF